MERLNLIRRIRCGKLEAVIASSPLPDGQTPYGVYFRRVPQAGDGVDRALFDFGELLTVAKLARMAHASLVDTMLASLDDE